MYNLKMSVVKASVGNRSGQATPESVKSFLLGNFTVHLEDVDVNGVDLSNVDIRTLM